jgi:hypothetical protein
VSRSARDITVSHCRIDTARAWSVELAVVIRNGPPHVTPKFVLVVFIIWRGRVQNTCSLAHGSAVYSATA